MPGFAAVLDDDQRWAVIDFIRARNAGATVRRTGNWSPPLRAPTFDAGCGTSTIRSTDLRGKFVLLRFGAAAAPASSDVVTILAGADPHPSSGDGCVSRDEAVPLAYAIVSGVDASALPGTTFLIDDQGWMRAMQHPGDSPTWSDASSLEAELRLLRSHRVIDPTAPMDMPM